MRKRILFAMVGAMLPAAACSTNKSDAPGMLNSAVSTQELKVNVVGTGAGSVGWKDWNVTHTCTTNCTSPVPNGDVVVLTAIPNGSNQFAGWIGDCSGMSSTCSVTVNGSKSVSAAFSTSGNPPLVVTTLGYGTVTAGGAGTPALNCGTLGAVCSSEFAPGSTVTLTAAPDANQTFNGWSGACSGTTPTCSVSMTAAQGVTAMFSGKKLSLDVALAGDGVGGVTSAPAGISCGSVTGGGASCGYSYQPGTVVTLTEVPTGSNVFTGWEGACTGLSNTCVVTMTGNTSARANFSVPGVVANTSADTSTIVVAKGLYAANGVAVAPVTVKILDNKSNPVAGVTVHLAASGTSTVVSADQVTAADGTAVFTVSSTAAQTETLSASTISPAVTLHATASVTFSSQPGTVTGQVVYVTGTNGSGPTTALKSAAATTNVGVAGATVKAQYWDDTAGVYVTSVTTTTDANGNYSLANVPSGATFVVVDGIPSTSGPTVNGTLLRLLPGETRASFQVVPSGSVTAATITLSSAPPDGVSNEYVGRAVCNTCHSGPDIRAQAHYRALTNVFPTPEMNAVYMGQAGGNPAMGGQPSLVNPTIPSATRAGAARTHLWPEDNTDIVDTGVLATNPNYDPNDPGIYNGTYTAASADGAGQVEVYLCNVGTAAAPSYAMKFGGLATSCSDGSFYNATTNADPQVPMVHIATIYGGQGDQSTINGTTALQNGYFAKPNVGSFKQNYLALLSEVKNAGSWTYAAGQTSDSLVLPVELHQSGDTAANGAPLFGGFQATEQKNPGESWSQRTRTFSRVCAGCHNVGLQLGWTTQTITPPFPVVRNGVSSATVTYAAVNSYTYVDQKFSCEHCHGPGGAHAKNAGCTVTAGVYNCAAKPTTGYSNGIIRPNYLTTENERQICAKCHGYGNGTSGHLTSGGANQTYGFEFPWSTENQAGSKAGTGNYIGGAYDISTYFDNWGGQSSDGIGFWDPAKTDGTLFSQVHRSQYIELSQAKHANNADEKIGCADCHSAHSLALKGVTPQPVVSPLSDAGINYSLGAPSPAPGVVGDNNAQCLNCHAGKVGGPFANLTLEDVAAINLATCVTDVITNGVYADGGSPFPGPTCGKMTKTLTNAAGTNVACSNAAPCPTGFVCSSATGGTCGWVWGGSTTTCSGMSTVGAACNVAADCTGTSAGFSCVGGSGLAVDAGGLLPGMLVKTGSCMNPTANAVCTGVGFNGCYNPGYAATDAGVASSGLCFNYCTTDVDCSGGLSCTNPSGVKNAGYCINPAAGAANVAAAVNAHMNDKANMGKGYVYDPLGTGLNRDSLPVGRCTSCHMPQVGRSGGYTTGPDSHGNDSIVSGDIASHSWKVVMPSSVAPVGEQSPTFQGGNYGQYTSDAGVTYDKFARMPSSCGLCHVGGRSASVVLPATAVEYPSYWPIDSHLSDNPASLPTPCGTNPNGTAILCGTSSLK